VGYRSRAERRSRSGLVATPTLRPRTPQNMHQNLSWPSACGGRRMAASGSLNISIGDMRRSPSLPCLADASQKPHATFRCTLSPTRRSIATPRRLLRAACDIVADESSAIVSDVINEACGWTRRCETKPFPRRHATLKTSSSFSPFPNFVNRSTCRCNSATGRVIDAQPRFSSFSQWHSPANDIRRGFASETLIVAATC